MMACRFGHLLVVKALLPHTDLRHLNNEGCALLHEAAVCNEAMLEAVLPRYVEAGLVDLPTGVNSSNVLISTGRTALSLACHSALYGAAKLLLEAGATRHSQTSRGSLPVGYCVEGTSLSCLQLLLGTAPNWYYTPQQLNLPDRRGWTILQNALQIATHSDTGIDACRMLIAAGANTNVQTPDGETCANKARRWRPDRPDLAALFDPDGVQEPLPPPCCANCQKSGIDVKLSACAGCHRIRYCSKVCQRAHWQEHKGACLTPDAVYKAHVAKFG